MTETFISIQGGKKGAVQQLLHNFFLEIFHNTPPPPPPPLTHTHTHILTLFNVVLTTVFNTSPNPPLDLV